MVPLPAEIWRLRTRRVGKQTLVYDELASTNTHAAAYVEGDGIAVLARSQTRGRGQYGRSWLSEPGMGVWLSVVLLPVSPVRPAVLTAWAAVSVCEAVYELTGLQARIKWPNDVLIRGRKVCGILIESSANIQAGFKVTAGIGLNVAQLPEYFDQAGLPQAASLACFRASVTTEEVAKCLLAKLDQWHESMMGNEIGALEAIWKWRVGLLGKHVEIETVHATTRGRLVEMEFAGLRLLNEDGSMVSMLPEAIRHMSSVK